MQSFTGEKYPKCIKTLLSDCAYSTQLSLLELDESKLEKLENHINANRQLLTQLKCCYSDEYKNQTQFHFLPGHRATILGIRSQINKMKENQIEKKRTRVSKPKQVRSPEELKEKLIKSLDAASVKMGFPAKLISERNIVDFNGKLVNGEQIYKCGFSCVFCSRIVPITYKTYWQTTNATNHFRTHYQPGMSFQFEDVPYEN